jgi:hypothetical protein
MTSPQTLMGLGMSPELAGIVAPGLGTGGGSLGLVVPSSAAVASPITTADDSRIDVTLTANTVLSFPTPASGSFFSFQLVVRQNAVGFWVLGFPAAVTWNGGGTAFTGTFSAPYQPWLPNDFAIYQFETINGGVSWAGAQIAEPYAPVLFDNFNRANSASTLGGAVVGGSWTANTGTWGISSNQAYLPTEAGNSVATLNAGKTLSYVAASITAVSSNNAPGLMVQWLDATHWIYGFIDLTDGGMQVWQNNGGSFSQLAAPGSLGAVVNVPQRLLCVLTSSGAAQAWYLNGALAASTTGTAASTAQHAGFYCNDANGGFWDDFVAA